MFNAPQVLTPVRRIDIWDKFQTNWAIFLKYTPRQHGWFESAHFSAARAPVHQHIASLLTRGLSQAGRQELERLLE